MPFSVVVDFSFADEGKCDMSKLYEVSACAYASVLRYERIYAFIDEFFQKQSYIGMNS